MSNYKLTPRGDRCLNKVQGFVLAGVLGLLGWAVAAGVIMLLVMVFR